jgi:small subunit ribosomal protein S14
MYLAKKIKKNSISSIHDFCIITGRSKAIIKDFKLSRIKFKEFALKGLLPNISTLS